MWGGFSISLLSDVSSRRSDLSLSRPYTFTISTLLEKTASALNKFGCLVGFCTTIPKFAASLHALSIEALSDPFAQAYGVIVLIPYLGTYMLSTQLNHGAGLENSGSFGELEKTKKVYSMNRLGIASNLAQDITDYNVKGSR